MGLFWFRREAASFFMYLHLIERKQSMYSVFAAILLCLYVILAATTPAHAQGTASTTEPGSNNPPAQTTPVKHANLRTELQQKKEMLQQNRGERKELHASTTEMPRENVQQKIETRKENVAEHKQNMQERKDARASTTEQRKEGRKERLTDAAKTRIHAHAEKMWKRFNAATMRLEELARRIDSRITKLEEKEGNLTEARRLLNLAHEQIAEAKTAVEQGKAAVEAAIVAENPELAFQQAQNVVRTAQEKIKAAHNSLVQTIRAIHASTPSKPEDATTATTTPQV